MFDDRLAAELPECSADAILLDESSYSTDIHEFVQYLVNQGVAETEFRPRLVQWVADSLNQAIKKARIKAVCKYYNNLPKRTFYNWLGSYYRGGKEAIPPETPRKKSEHLLTQLWKPLFTGSSKGF
ncbi:hypothetical protein H6F67_26580 [Microcoleus sp. FACHB-1515]|uniref:hypothetical protein n=1 Tax=Cyanophyceae TaxID=3028117 RepID=UPI0016850FC5|nr:hypothetical protein [Microcoleus sp. FACHB-1515]MBD2093416.1 hypothetical protein [Microcoleus sp. FACHB-1515]